MGEYMFGVRRGTLPAATVKKIERIAKLHGCTFVGPVTIPGTGVQSWFAGPNRGFPFDDAMARAVFDDLDAAGLEYDTP